ncbi:hypothetical protein C7G98_05285 [Acinetobacter baumannii]|uniref:hypothetical protein n=1 Tax=Acinetobacter calcoaceticus/baumannii complex TaxID=909768 RepID=UPI000D0B558D|nr:hypothetical protein [Acinetobacter baumannii]MDH2580733.1 hypothetical protein [Acinetobacter baumannii]PSE11648.1 hypothetical protein C7G98_05285 [Acinetobacter baumannii]
MEKQYIYYNGPYIECSICKTIDTKIYEGESEHFKINIMLNKSNPGIYDQNLLGYALCKVCRKETSVYPLPYLYYN